MSVVISFVVEDYEDT